MSADMASDLSHLLTRKGLHEFVASHARMPAEAVARICQAGAPWPLGGLLKNPVVLEVVTPSQLGHLTAFFRPEPWAEDTPIPSSDPVEQGSRNTRLLPRIDRMLCEEIERVVPVVVGEDPSTVTHEPRYLMILSLHFERVAALTGVDVETVVAVADGLIAYSLRVWALVLERWPSEDQA